VEKVDFYTVFMRAADHIERHPDSFSFHASFVPEGECGTVGCALGWVGFYAHSKDVPKLAEMKKGAMELFRLEHRFSVGFVATHFNSHEGLFYKEMERICGDNTWMHNAKRCAKALRIYAEYHFTPPTRSGLDPALVKILGDFDKKLVEVLTT